MASNLRKASAALDKLHAKVQANNTRASDLSNDEKIESDAARKEAQEAMDVVTRLIAECNARYEASMKSKKPKHKVQNINVASTPYDPNQAFKNQTETNLQNVASTTGDMLESISQVMGNFNNILGLQGLNQFSATLESVPAVGVLNGTVQYVGISVSSGGDTNEAWTKLDTLPATPTGSDTISLFSCSGNFCVAIGENVWQKTPKTSGDPTLSTAATENWANLFNPGWQSLGACIPAGDSKCIIPYNQVNPDGTVVSTNLVRLASDGSLSWASDNIETNMQFQPLAPVSGAPPAAFVKIAYWNNSIWAYDQSYNLYELNPTIDINNGLTGYTLKSTTQLNQPISDLTAVDTGLVALRSDQTLYKLIINPPENSNSPPTTSWDPWIAQGGVTNLGAAAPGVMLDLLTLTTYLKSSYITTQTNLLPSINYMQAFCGSNGVYLSNLMTAAQQWQAATTPQERAYIAKNQGKIALQHARAMSSLLSGNLTSDTKMVVEMARQISGIHTTLNTQLTNIGCQLEALNKTLNTQEQQDKKLTAGLWGAVGALIVGIGAIVLGFLCPAAAPWLLLGGGALVLGSAVAVTVLGSLVTNLNQAIAQTQQGVVTLTNAQPKLQVITESFGNLTDEYGNLTTFWTEMGSICTTISDLEELGKRILGDQSSIQAAQNYNQQISNNLTSYVEVLGQQGITSTASGFLLPPQSFHGMDTPALVDYVQAKEPNKALHQTQKLNLVSDIMKSGTNQLAQKDLRGYIATMRKAVDLNADAHNLILIT